MLWQKIFFSSGDPVISVDCKKKELIGEYKNNGREWMPVETPTEVNVYDFIDKTNGKAVLYEIYDIAGNTGWVTTTNKWKDRTFLEDFE